MEYMVTLLSIKGVKVQIQRTDSVADVAKIYIYCCSADGSVCFPFVVQLGLVPSLCCTARFSSFPL